ncbi:MAG: hypothetical protein WCS09_02780 [Pseudomonadota bacterium]|jgi:hypothetical protein
MSGTLPLPLFPSSLTIGSTTPTLVSTAHSLKRQVRSRGGHRWTFRLGWAGLTQDQWQDLFGFLSAQRGQYETFEFTPRFQNRGSWAGSPVISGGSQTGRSVALEDFTAAATNVARRGDFIRFGNHNKVYMVTADVSADGSGNATLSIEPALFASPADGSSLTISQVPFRVGLTSDQLEVPLRAGPAIGSLELDLVEVP